MEIRLYDEQIKVGITVLPGVYESMEITGDIKTDEEELKSGKKVVTHSYNPLSIRLNMTLIPDDNSTPLQKLAEIQKVFRSSPSQTKPETYKFISSHTKARGIGQVMLMRLRSQDTNANDMIAVSLEFTAVGSTTVSVQTVQAASGKGTAYTVKKGDTLSAIAKANNTTADAIAKANNIANVDLIYTGQKITIPTASAAKTTKTTPTAAADVAAPKVK